MDLIEETNELLFSTSVSGFNPHVFFQEAICQHCAHWKEDSQDIPGWRYCTRRLDPESEDSGLVGETGPRFGCVHWRADGADTGS